MAWSLQVWVVGVGGMKRPRSIGVELLCGVKVSDGHAFSR